MPVTIFFCYARKDKALLNDLIAHLSPLQREGLIEVWSDREIPAGKEWEPEIKKQLNAAQIVLLLVSPDFMNSDYCYRIEMQRALERHERGEAKVIPIILRPVYWRGKPLGKLQALPTDGKPVTGPDWHNQDTALNDVTEGIYKVVEQLRVTPSTLPLVVEVMQPQETQFENIPSHVQQARKVASPLPSFEVENLVEFRVLRTLTGHISGVSSVAISPDGRTLVSGSIYMYDFIQLIIGKRDDTIRVWDLSTGQQVRTLIGHTYSVHSIAISPDGRTLVSGSWDKTIRVWDLSTGQQVRTLTGHTGIVNSIAISPDRGTLVSGGWDQTIRVWDLSTGQQVRTLTGHTGAVSSVAISPDGRMLVSGSLDKTIRVWGI